MNDIPLVTRYVQKGHTKFSEFKLGLSKYFEKVIIKDKFLRSIDFVDISSKKKLLVITGPEKSHYLTITNNQNNEKKYLLLFGENHLDLHHPKETKNNTSIHNLLVNFINADKQDSCLDLFFEIPYIAYKAKTNQPNGLNGTKILNSTASTVKNYTLLKLNKEYLQNGKPKLLTNKRTRVHTWDFRVGLRLMNITPKKEYPKLINTLKDYIFFEKGIFIIDFIANDSSLKKDLLLSLKKLFVYIINSDNKDYKGGEKIYKIIIKTNINDEKYLKIIKNNSSFININQNINKHFPFLEKIRKATKKLDTTWFTQEDLFNYFLERIDELQQIEISKPSVSFFGLLTDYYTLLRMFTKFDPTGNKPTRHNCGNQSPTNILHYAGSDHTKIIYGFLKYLSSKNNNRIKMEEHFTYEPIEGKYSKYTFIEKDREYFSFGINPIAKE